MPDIFRRPRVVLAVVLVLLTLIFSYLSKNIRWDSDLLAFFSADSADVQAVERAASAGGLANQLRVDVHGAVAGTSDETIRSAARALADNLRKDSRFRSVWSGVDPTKLADSYAQLAADAPAILTDEQRRQIFARADDAAALEKRFDSVQNQLVDPDGEIVLRRLQADPLGVQDFLAAQIASLSPAKSANTSLADGQLTARDAAGGLHIMLVLEPVASASQQSDAPATPDEPTPAQTLAALHDSVAALQKQFAVAVWTVGPLRSYTENAQRVMHDVAVISIAGSLAVALAIALFFRRIWPAVICMIPPFVGIGAALGIAGIFHVTLPLILLGFAGLLCGSTTDYGIQLIAECRNLWEMQRRQWTEDIPRRAARRLAAPISMSVATSVTGFAALALSASPGLRALGLFVAGSTLCIWLTTFLVLPCFVGPHITGSNILSRGGLSSRWVSDLLRRIRLLALLSFIAATIYFCGDLGASDIRFNTDARALDGSSQAARSEEASFYNVWGDLRNRAIVLVSGATAGDALQTLSRVDNALADQHSEGLLSGVISPGGIVPDDATRAARIAAWQSFWTPERRAALGVSLSQLAQSHGLKPVAFANYAAGIADIPAISAEARLTRSPAALFPGLTDGSDRGVTLALIVQMNPTFDAAGGSGPVSAAPESPQKLVSPRAASTWATEMRLRFPEVTILSGQLLLFDATDRARAEGERLAPFCALAILLPLWIYFRRLTRAWLVMLCLVIGFGWVLGAAQIYGGGLNLLSLVPVLFTLGVAVDYGIYAATDPMMGPSTRSPATFLCFFTTLLGSGSLLLASHPALHWLGLTLVAGISGGYLTSLLIVTPLVRRAKRIMPPIMAGQGVRAWLGRVRRMAAFIVPRLVLVILTLLLAVPPVTEFLLGRQRPANLAPAHRHAAVEQLGPRTWAADNSFLAWQRASDTTGLWQFRLMGSAEDRGYATAALAAPIDFRIENEMLDQLDFFLPNEWPRYFVLRTMAADMLDLQSFIPSEYQQEIYWTAHYSVDPHRYLAPGYPRILSYHALHDISQMLIDNPLIVPNTFACTGVVSLPGYSAPSHGHLLLARNFDFEGGESFGRQKSLTVVIPPKDEGIPFAHVAWPGLSGAVTGINQEKIALFINAAATKDFRRIGTPTIVMARDILQHARSIADAEAIIRKTQVFVSDILVIADGKTGQARIFEKSPAATAFYDVDSSAVVANHLVTPAFRDDPVNRQRATESTTTQRQARARQLLDRMKGAVTPQALAGLLRDKKALDDMPLGLGNRNAIDGLIACHSVIIDATAGKIFVAAWPYAEGPYLQFDLATLLDPAVNIHEILQAPAPILIPPDAMMNATGPEPSGWDRLLASREAGEEATALLQNFAGDPATLERILDRAQAVMENNPDFYLGHELKGRALLLQRNPAAAKVELSRALALDPPYLQRRTAIEALIKQCDAK